MDKISSVTIDDELEMLQHTRFQGVQYEDKLQIELSKKGRRFFNLTRMISLLLLTGLPGVVIYREFEKDSPIRLLLLIILILFFIQGVTFRIRDTLIFAINYVGRSIDFRRPAARFMNLFDRSGFPWQYYLIDRKGLEIPSKYSSPIIMPRNMFMGKYIPFIAITCFEVSQKHDGDSNSKNLYAIIGRKEQLLVDVCNLEEAKLLAIIAGKLCHIPVISTLNNKQTETLWLGEVEGHL